jgi:pSer/pThr/pTyr-binding forkhead associated (FHA) protein
MVQRRSFGHEHGREFRGPMTSPHPSRPPSASAAPPGNASGAGEAPATRFRLLVADGARVETFSLPAIGEVAIGRSADCHVRIDDSRLDGQHALLVMGPKVILRDLGSTHGCSAGGRRLAANESVVIAPGMVIAIGAATLVLQRGQATSRLRPVRSHAYFEARVEDEQIRAETSRTMFALVRLRCRPNASTKVETVLAHWLRPMDVVANVAPDDYEILLVDIAREPAKELFDAIVRELAEEVVGFALGSYPREDAEPSTFPSAVPPELAVTGRGHMGVLLLGESGVGKEVAAQAMHRKSARANGPLVTVSCTLPEAELEIVLFGQERGAFIGADETKLGALEQARAGTLFLDDVAELPPPIQRKLLSALEQRQVIRKGAIRPRSIDVRVISATQRDLEADVARGAFRSDLYSLLAGATLVIAPLRDRRGEIIALAETFIDECCPAGPNRSVPTLSAEGREILEGYSWPGNVRELRAVIERAVQVCRDGWIGGEQLRRLGEREDIVNALAQCAGNQSQAARILGMSRKTLVKRLDEFSLPRPRKWVP